MAKEASARKRDQHVGKIASKGVPTLLPDRAVMAARRAMDGMEAFLGALRALEEARSAKEGPPGAYGALLDGSWGALGAEHIIERFFAAPKVIPRQVPEAT